MAKKQKYYVVWHGKTPGIYHSWDSCKAQITGFPAARYKSFEVLAEAEYAFKHDPEKFIKKSATINTGKKTVKPDKSSILQNSICVDAACSGNPGDMEYRGVDTFTGNQIFHQGPFKQGTNNIGEFLALVHALALLEKKGNSHTTIYSDSKIAIGWVHQKKAKTKLDRTSENEIIFVLLERAEKWLQTHNHRNPVVKWETDVWGEIPADFGRK
jgi:ribonuclease HI